MPVREARPEEVPPEIAGAFTGRIREATPEEVPPEITGSAPSSEQLHPLVRALETASSYVPSPLDALKHASSFFGLDTAPGAGGLMGGAAVLSQALPWWTKPLAIPAAGLGAGLMTEAESAGRYAGRHLLVNPVRAALGQEPLPVPSAQEAFIDYPLQAAKRAALGQAYGLLGGWTAGKLLRLAAPLTGSISPQAQQMRDTASQLSPDLLLSSAQETGKGAGYEGFSRFTPGGEELSREFYGAQRPAIEAGMREKLGTLSAPQNLEAGGEQLAKGMQATAATAKARYQPLYKEAYTAAGKEPYPTPHFDQAKFDMAMEASGLGQLKTPAQKMAPGLLPPPAATSQAVTQGMTDLENLQNSPKWQGQTIPVAAQREWLTKMGTDPDLIDVIVNNAPVPGAAPFEKMHDVSKGLGEIIRGEERAGLGGMTTPKGRHAVLLKKAIDQDMQEVMDQNSAVKNPFTQAQDIFRREYADVLLNPKPITEAGSMIGTEWRPGMQLQALIPKFFGPGKSVDALQALDRAIGPQAYDAANAAHVHTMIERATEKGEFSPATWLSQANTYLKNPELIQQMFKYQPQAGQNFIIFTKFLQKLERQTPSGTSALQSGRGMHGLWTMLTILHALEALFHGEPERAALGTALLQAPPVLARLFYSKVGINALTKIASAGPHLPAQVVTNALTTLKTAALTPTPWEQSQATD